MGIIACASCALQRFAQHGEIADVVREQQDQSRVDRMTLLERKPAVRIEQRLVELVAEFDVGFDVEPGHALNPRRSRARRPRG